MATKVGPLDSQRIPEGNDEDHARSESGQTVRMGGVSQKGEEFHQNSSENGDKIEEDVEELGSVPSQPLYSIFSQRQKYFITIMVTFAAFYSPLSSSMYFPILNTLAANLNVSNAMINLTITSYMIFQGLAPMIFGTFSDQFGRRPAYITAFTVYLAANIGLALQNSYVALVLLRCLQSTGSSCTIAIGVGVISDIATPSERGSYMGMVFGGIMLGPAIGPVIGGLLAHFLGWQSIFWFLAVGSGAFLTIYVIFVHETSRKVVGNGSQPPQKWNMSFLTCIQLVTRKGSDVSKDKTPKQAEPLLKKKGGWPNPFKSIYVLLEKDVGIAVVYNSFLMVAFYDVLASLPSLFKAIYDFDDLHIGLCYLPFGIGCAIASILNGRLLDWNYKHVAQKNNFAIDIRRGDDLKDFPIEQARLGAIWPALYVGLASILAYGWALEQNSPLVGPLILLFIIGMCLTASTNTFGTLLIDMYPMNSATVTAGNNIVRCGLGAGATALIDTMISRMGTGWCFTFLALFCVATSPVLLVELRYGMQWREARRMKVAAKVTKGVEKMADAK